MHVDGTTDGYRLGLAVIDLLFFMQLLWQKDILKYFAFYLQSNGLVECLDERQKGCVLQLSLSLGNKQINQHLLFYVRQRPRATFSLLSQIKQTAESSLQPPSITSSISNCGEIVNKNCVCLLIVYDFWAVQSSDSDQFIHLIPFLVPLNFAKDHRHCSCRIDWVMYVALLLQALCVF